MTTTAADPKAGFDLEGFTQRYVAAWNGCDTDAMAELITDDIVWIDPAMPEPAQGVDMWTMRDGRIAGYRAYYDMNDVVRQLGILPEPGSRAERMSAALQRL